MRAQGTGHDHKEVIAWKHKEWDAGLVWRHGEGVDDMGEEGWQDAVFIDEEDKGTVAEVARMCLLKPLQT